MTGIYNIFSLRTFDVCLSCISCLSVYIKSLIMISIYTWELADIEKDIPNLIFPTFTYHSRKT